MRVKPLDDILVIEIDSWMASPSAGAILADLGARVIKIEPPDGDPMRDMGRPPKIEERSRILICNSMWTTEVKNRSLWISRQTRASRLSIRFAATRMSLCAIY